jgi:ribosomal protein S30
MTLGRNEPPKKAMAEKPSILPLVLAALGGGTIVFLLSQFQFSLWIEPSGSKDSTPPVIEVAPDVTPPSSLSPSPAPPPAPPQPPLVNGLRVRNISPYPVRVVLMSQQSASQQPASQQAVQNNSSSSPYRAPVHWDFAPDEGSKAGLLLSLPEGNFTLKKGDVLMAFALDGSRHYWGPYIVGKTGGLSRSKASEWQLVLKP